MNYACDNLCVFIEQNMVVHATYLKMEINNDTIIGLNKRN
jgi:hypothetical protein